MKKLLAAIYLAFTVSLAVSAEYDTEGLSPEKEMLYDYYKFSDGISGEEMIRLMANKSYMYCRTLGNHMDRIGALVHANSDIAITDRDALSDYLETINTLTKIADKFHAEPPRVYRRLHFLRGWSDEQNKQIFPGSAGTSGAHGFRT